MAPAKIPVAERFLSRIELAPTGCWHWTGARGHFGHGILRIDRKNRLAHRVSFELFIGPIGAGLVVLHGCDVPWCVNPEHLSLGTQAENLADMAHKGRGRTSKTGLPYGVKQRSRKFQAFVTSANKQHYLGMFSTVEEASAVALRFKKDKLL